MKIDNISDAKKLRDRMHTEHERLHEWRMLRDRRDTHVAGIEQALPERVKALYMPVQSQEPDDEIQARKHVLASNEAGIEVVSRTNDPKVLKLGQSYQDALEALHEALFPITVQLDECDGFLGDDKTVLALDYLGPGPELGKFAKRPELEDAVLTPDKFAEDSAEGQYVRAWIAFKGDHEKAYDAVTREAMVRDGLRYRVRVLDRDTWDEFLDIDGVTIGMEDGEIDIHPALRTLEAYGVKEVGNRLMLTGPSVDDDDDEPALGVAPVGVTSEGQLTTDSMYRIRYTQIRTREQIIILADRPAGHDADGEGIFITYDTPLDDHTGYVIIEGDTKLRRGEDRCQPVTLGLLETHQRLNMLKSVALAMSLDEATRDVYATQTTPGVQPIDPTQEVKGQQVENGTAIPQVPEIKRVETTGIELAKMIELTTQEVERYKMHEGFTGIGQSGETGIHLARVLSQYAMRMQPYQTKRAAAHKEVLMTVAKAAIKNGSIFIPYLPRESGAVGSGIQVAQPRELTVEMAQAPLDVRITIGAESDETRYAASQMSEKAAAFGTISMTQHMTNYGVKDPHAMEAQILEDNVVRDAVGTPGPGGQPGWVPAFVRQTAQEVLAQMIQSLLPTPPPAPPQPPQGPPGAGVGPMPPEIPGSGAQGPGYVPPATQTAPGGVPVAPGMTGTPT